MAYINIKCMYILIDRCTYAGYYGFFTFSSDKVKQIFVQILKGDLIKWKDSGMEENKNIFANLIKEFNRTNNQTLELIRLQNDLTKNESELLAIQIRYVHK